MPSRAPVSGTPAPPDSVAETAGPADRLARIDRRITRVGLVLLLVLIVTSSRANLVADSVDYYAILQWVTPAEARPIVGNLHFAEQRSPGYSLTALIPYALFSVALEPFITTERVIAAGRPPGPPPGPPPGLARPPGSTPPGLEAARPPSPPSGPPGSELRLIPPRPLLFRQVPFKDFQVPGEGSWYQWKLALSLALTSYFFLFAGIHATGRVLRRLYPARPGYSLILLVIFTSFAMLHSLLATPLYATLAAFGSSALFLRFFLEGEDSGSSKAMLFAGFFLGLLVLTRLEAGVFAAFLAMALALRGGWRSIFLLVIGSSWSLAAWGAYNQVRFGTPIHLGILRGDINRLVICAGYLVDSLFHPASSLLLWSPLVVLGLAGLVWSRSAPLRAVGLASLALIALYLIRVPVMYLEAGGGPIDIGGIAVTPPPSRAAARLLVRADMNRYLTLFAPFAVIGLRDALERVRGWRASRAASRVTDR